MLNYQYCFHFVDKIIAAILTVVLMPFQALLPVKAPSALFGASPSALHQSSTPTTGPFPRPRDAAAAETAPANSPLIERAAEALGVSPDFLLNFALWTKTVRTNDGSLANDARVGTDEQGDFYADAYLQSNLKLAPALSANADIKALQRQFVGNVAAASMPPGGVSGLARQLFAERARIMQDAQNPQWSPDTAGGAHTHPNTVGRKSSLTMLGWLF